VLSVGFVVVPVGVLSVGFVVVPVGVLSVGFVVVPVGVVPVGFVVVPVGVLPVVSLEQVFEPLGSVDGVVVVALEPAVGVEPLVGQVVT